MAVAYYIFMFVLGFVLLICGSSLFVDSAVSLANKLHLPEVLIGATIVSIGTTLPESLFSTMASVHGLPDMALGNALGSILCNTGFIAGFMLMLRPIHLEKKALGNIMSGAFFLRGGFCSIFDWRDDSGRTFTCFRYHFVVDVSIVYRKYSEKCSDTRGTGTDGTIRREAVLWG